MLSPCDAGHGVSAACKGEYAAGGYGREAEGEYVEDMEDNKDKSAVHGVSVVRLLQTPAPAFGL
jgi:hypothetical protein